MGANPSTGCYRKDGPTSRRGLLALLSGAKTCTPRGQIGEPPAEGVGLLNYMVPSRFMLEFYKDANGNEPVREWLRNDLVP